MLTEVRREPCTRCRAREKA